MNYLLLLILLFTSIKYSHGQVDSILNRYLDLEVAVLKIDSYPNDSIGLSGIRNAVVEVYKNENLVASAITGKNGNCVFDGTVFEYETGYTIMAHKERFRMNREYYITTGKRFIASGSIICPMVLEIILEELKE